MSNFNKLTQLFFESQEFQFKYFYYKELITNQKIKNRTNQFKGTGLHPHTVLIKPLEKEIILSLYKYTKDKTGNSISLESLKNEFKDELSMILVEEFFKKHSIELNKF